MLRPTALTILACGVVAAGSLLLGCGGSSPTASPTVSVGPVASSPAPADLNELLHELFKDVQIRAEPAAIGGLMASGVEPELSWTPVPGADSYLVTVRADDEPVAWTWVGSSTSVTYGAMSDVLDQITQALDAPIRLVIARPGISYRWTVSAADVDGVLIAESSAVFDCDDTQLCAAAVQP